MAIEKTLANCTLTEFVVQSVKIKRRVVDWMKKTELVSRLRIQPKFTGEETEAERNAICRKQAQHNIDDAITHALETEPEETAKIIALMCFVEPEQMDDFHGIEYLTAALELAQNPEVISFFTSLLSLGQTGLASK